MKVFFSSLMNPFWGIYFLIPFFICFICLRFYIFLSSRVCIGEKVEMYLDQLNFLHRSKKMTPTSGGVIFISLFMIWGCLLMPSFVSTPLFWGTLCFFVIGLLDDSFKMFRGHGLSQLSKILFQTFVFIGISYFFRLFEYQDALLSFIGCSSFHFFVLFYLWFGVVGTVNAVNLTDGLDGLCVTQVLIVLLALLFLNGFSSFPLYVILGALLLAFFLLNRFPAQIFMGDSGAMSLGAVVVFSFIQCQRLYLLPLMGLIFVVETLSVMIQVAYYRRTGRRLFKASPLHHHFQLQGKSENRIVFCFLMVSFWVNTFVLLGFYLF